MEGKTYLNTNQYFKPTYHQALKYIVPDLYEEDDRNNFGTENDLRDQVINSHIDIAQNISSVLFISSIAGTVFSSMDTVEGIYPYFVKQNGLTEITVEKFIKKILNRVGQKLANFATSAEFSNYLTDTLLPSIQLNNPTSYFTLGESWSSTHQYLIENLSWLYFLNTSGSSYSPSSYVHDTLVENIYNGNAVLLNDGIKGLTEHVWRNGLTTYYPDTFVSSAGTFTSGTQQLENLKTWVDILYSPLYADRSDFTIRDRFRDYLDNGSQTTNLVAAGPFTKLLRTLSLAAFDINNETEVLGSLYSIEECPAEYLPLLADLIGWRLFGSNEDRWRLQLKNAVEVYKRVGTKRGLQFALNSVFPKDIFGIESRVTELWESYIPYLIHYSLATESEYFVDNFTWTQNLAAKMNVGSYSPSSIDENMKLATDRIIYETYLEFSSSFNIPNIDNKFYYRNREFPIPPFEEYPYYVNVEINQDMIDFITDRLVCFGVRREFAFQVRDYLVENTINSDDEIRSSSWLFFTSGYSEPPNMDRLIANLHDKRFEYASLWNGKSSHFKLMFDSSDFDFDIEDELDPETGNAIKIASKVVNEFSPAHAIPLINLQLSSVDYTDFSSTTLPILDFDQTENGNYNTAASALYVYSYRRDRTNGRKFGREGFDSLTDPIITEGSGVGSLSRNTIRKRNYQTLLTKDGYYDRTGYNMPIGGIMGSSTASIPLGFIPSSLSFQSVSDIGNLPAVYGKCEGLTSDSSYYGYDVSNTMICRGQAAPGLYVRHYVDRGQLPDIYALMHRLKEEEKLTNASSNISYSSFVSQTWRDDYQSYANSSTNLSGGFPNSYDDYSNFAFGLDLHSLYRQYTAQFNRHQLAEHLHYLNGPNIFAHTFGSILRNSDFDILGADSASFITSSLSSIQTLNGGTGLFNISGVSGGSYVASSQIQIPIGGIELRASSVLQGIELIQTSGASLTNSFRVFHLTDRPSLRNSSDYIVNNTFIQTKSINGFPRIKFDIKTYESPASEGHPLTENFLLPDMEYSFSVKSLASNGNGTILGEASLGVWIHTKDENGYCWSFTPSGEWLYHSTSALTKIDVINYSHKFDYKLRDRLEEAKESKELYKKLTCIELLSGIGPGVDPLATFDEDDFENFSVSFNTENRSILHPNQYFKHYGNVHRKNQNYVFEVFKFPDNSRRSHFVLLDSVNLVNDKFNRWSKKLIGGDILYYPMRQQYCPENRIPLERDGIQTLFRFWNDIAGKNYRQGLASRDSTITSGLLEVSGGSRIDYRTKTGWHAPDYYTPVATPLIIGYLYSEI